MNFSEMEEQRLREEAEERDAQQQRVQRSRIVVSAILAAICAGGSYGLLYGLPGETATLSAIAVGFGAFAVIAAYLQ